jgi:chorismate mutase-like protein
MPEDPAQALAACRTRIDAVDLRILALLSERTAIVQEIGRIKKEAQLAVYEPRREDQVFANVTNNNHGPLPDDALRRIFERIIDEMRKVQKDRMEETPRMGTQL